MTDASEESVTMRISAAKWSTFVAPFDVTIPSGVEAYTVTTDGATIGTEAVTTTIPANTPVLIYKDVTEAWTQEFTDYAQSYYTGLPATGNLTGLLATGGTVPQNAYVLQKQDDVVGFYKVSDASGINGTQYRAYLTISDAGGSAKAFLPLSDDATSIQGASAENHAAADVFTLSGIRGMRKGINIVRTADGTTHKVLVK